MYYNRFGKCNRGEKCPFIHDPDKVAVCTRYIRGMSTQLTALLAIERHSTESYLVDGAKELHRLLKGTVSN
ncbi:UNVERIFIED_CONTAM: hypothetical protein FKN15_023485 [Acipenser sinensis]